MIIFPYLQKIINLIDVEMLNLIDDDRAKDDFLAIFDYIISDSNSTDELIWLIELGQKHPNSKIFPIYWCGETLILFAPSEQAACAKLSDFLAKLTSNK